MHAEDTDAGDTGMGPARGETQDLVDALRRLAVLRDRDVLTEEEYRLAKEMLVAEDASGPDETP